MAHNIINAQTALQDYPHIQVDNVESHAPLRGVVGQLIINAPTVLYKQYYRIQRRVDFIRVLHRAPVHATLHAARPRYRRNYDI